MFKQPSYIEDGEYSFFGSHSSCDSGTKPGIVPSRVSQMTRFMITSLRLKTYWDWTTSTSQERQERVLGRRRSLLEDEQFLLQHSMTDFPTHTSELDVDNRVVVVSFFSRYARYATMYSVTYPASICYKEPRG